MKKPIFSDANKTQFYTKPALKWLACLLLLVLIQGCTNAKFVISPLYNRLDDQMRKEFNKLGDFNDEQVAAFEASLGTYHVWHRQRELPAYAQLMNEFADSIAVADSTSKADIARWVDTVEQHTRALRECHPVNFSFDLIRSLTDKQLDFIEARFKKQQEKNIARYETRTREERIDRRIRNVVKYAGRLGFDVTPTQRAMLLSTFKRQNSLRKEYYQLSGEWNKQFFNLARNQENPNYDADMRLHLSSLWDLLENAHQEQWQGNRDLWK